VLRVPADDTMAAAVREAAPALRGEVAVSCWGGLALVRLAAADGAPLRHDLVVVLTALGCRCPRLWLN